jgi:D-glycero-D-manno-heptose 1,7-bisphosphate phosphatase
MSDASKSKALFLDRDGVINHDVGYLHRVEDVRWVDGIFQLCRAAVKLGYKLVVVTNQSGIARGLYSEADFHALMQWMELKFAREQAPLDAVYYCPFHPVHGVGEYKREHEDRKPGPGMVLRAARELGLDLGQSVFVGDRCSDIQAGNAAGVGRVFLLLGTEEAACSGEFEEVVSLAEVEERLPPLPLSFSPKD